MKTDPTSNQSLSWTTASWVKWGAIVLFIGWLFFAVSAYYVVQKPFSGQQLAEIAALADSWMRLPLSVTAVANSLLNVAAAAWIAWVATGVGLLLLGWLKIELDSLLERGLYAMALGLGALGLLVLGIGLAGLLHTWVLLLMLIVLTTVTFQPMWVLVRQVRPLPTPRWMIFYLTVAIGLAFFVALLPPKSWDALSYHLVGPKLYLAAGRIYPGIDNPPLNYPFLQEMLYLFAMGVRGDIAAKLLHFLFNFLLAGLVYVMARDQLAVKRSGFAVLFLFGIPMILALSAQAYNDLSLAFYQVAALVAFFHWQQKQRSQWLVLAGLFCGLAMGMKYTSFVTPFVLACLVLWAFRGRWRQAVRPLLTLTLVTTAVALPWFVKNMVFTGNPVYPFLFDGLLWDEYRNAAFAAAGTGIGFDLFAILRLPYELTLGIGDVSQDAAVGVFLLLFLPLIILYTVTPLGKGAPRPLKQIVLFALAQYAFWTVGVIFSSSVRQSRFLLAAFVALCPVMAWILEDLVRFDTPQFSLRRVLGMVIIVILLLNLVGQVMQWLPLAPHIYVLGDDGRDTTLTRLLGAHYAAMQGINDLLPEDAVVTFLYEPRSYYCERDCRPDLLLDELGHMEYLHGDAPHIADAWRQEGVTHLLIFDAGYSFLAADDNEAVLPLNHTLLGTLREQELEPIVVWPESYSLYALK